jgi:hypothetical protein
MAPSASATHKNHGPPLARLASQITKNTRLIASQDPQAARHAGENLSRPVAVDPGGRRGERRAGSGAMCRSVRKLAGAGPRQVRHDLVKLAEGLRRVGLVQALVELLLGQPAGGQMLAQGGGGLVAVGVGGAGPRIAGHRHPPLQLLPSGSG